MDSYQPPPPYMRPPSGPPPPADPYHQYYQHPARPPVPPPTQAGGPAWYSNQFHNPHSPSPPPPPPPQWGPPSAYPPFPTHSHQPPFNAGVNGNSQFPPPAGHHVPPPYPQANQEWGNPNWGSQQGHTSQANSDVEDWAVRAKEWAAANQDQHSQSATNQPSGQIYQQYPNQNVHQQAAPGLSYQQFPVPPSTQPERYPNYASGNESFPGGSSAGFSHQENLPTSSAIHQQEVPYSYSSVAGKEESGNATQHEMQISVPDGGGPVRAEQQMQYGYGEQTAAAPSNLSDQPLQFATRDSSDYASLHNTWQPHAATGVVYPSIPSSVPSVPQHDSSMAMPPVSGHTMQPFGRFPPPNLQPVGAPYAYATKPPLHPAATFMDDSYAASSVPPKKAPVPNWLREELLKNKASLERPSSGSFEERDSMDDDVLYKPLAKVDQREDERLSPAKSSDEEEEEDEDEMDEVRAAEIKRILTEVLRTVTDELFDEIATKVINEDEAVAKEDSVQHNPKSSSSLLSADPTHKASAKNLVSVEGANKKDGSGSLSDVLLGLASYASDDDEDTDAASNADVDCNDEVLGVGSRNDVHQQPSTEKLPEPKEMVNARFDPKIEVGDMSPKNKSGLDQILNSRRNDDVGGSYKNLDTSASAGLDVDTLGSRTNHPDRTDIDKDAILDEPHRKNSGVKPDSNLRQDSNKSSGEYLSDDVSRDRNRSDETETGKEKVDPQNGSKGRMRQNDIKSAEKVKGFESNNKSTDLHVKKDSRDADRAHRTNSKEDRGKKRNKEKEEERSRHRQAEDSTKNRRRRSPTSNGSSDDSTRKSRSRRRNISPSPVRSRRKRSSPSSDESSDDSRRKSSSRRRNRSPSPVRSKRRHVSSRSPHSKNSQRKHTLHSSHDTSRSKRSRSRSPRRRHRA
ncbi:transcription elongation regulator 1 isoform X2 [Eutrema salsugineum]|uniref:transcription elongation regulator 1 isoform X2 n=1 Tax=Eutrema salsugineum TaxID=72664 RepID=UPI000CED4DAF|nr:transcription elongation regulator 1 isoform X2 [Eutrema salsugineum]